MPLKNEAETEYTVNGTPMHRGMFRRLNTMVFLTICSIFFILTIIAALIVFTFLPIFTTTKGDQTRYQVRSQVLKLVYNLPDRLSILPMDWTYEQNDFESDKLFILQNLLQDQLNSRKTTKKTSINIMDAFITRQSSSATTVPFVYPVTLNNNNNSIIVITQSDNSTQINSTTQLVISLRLRYALECTKRCQTDMKESIFAKTFQNLGLPIDTFQRLFTDTKTLTKQLTPSSVLLMTESTTLKPCIINTPPSVFASSVILAVNYEAESLLNTFISTTTALCSACSGERKVTNIGYTNELIFHQIISQYGGSTIVIFYYTTDRIRSAEIMINSIAPSINITFPTMSPNQNITSLPVTLNLCQGFNSIRIYNPNAYTPDFDRIIVY